MEPTESHTGLPGRRTIDWLIDVPLAACGGILAGHVLWVVMMWILDHVRLTVTL